MQFKLGDKILFKSENQKGEIVKINSPFKLTVQTEDGFEVLASVKDLVKVEINTDKAHAYGNYFHQKDNGIKLGNSFKRVKSSTILKIDLHIELLSGSYQYLDNFEIVQIQLNECQLRIEKALQSNYQKLIIVHGIGAGSLKAEVHKLLHNYNLRFYLSKDAGATEVML
jgi:dsDNA-specific endonuclease/ATPase MutS2